MASYEYTDLIKRLTDLTRLTLPPSPGERTGCQSSRDRRSHYDATSGTYQAWDANDDGSGFIRRDGERIVVFDEDGPGVIWRVWSALPGAGWIRIWLDGADEPAVALPFRDFFERSAPARHRPLPGDGRQRASAIIWRFLTSES